MEFMLKNAQLYKGTEGWGWGRWRGLDLQPYGGDARFVNECTGCHMPVSGDDYVYTLPITTANQPRGSGEQPICCLTRKSALSATRLERHHYVNRSQHSYDSNALWQRRSVTSPAHR